jgi:succinate dehydrogenase flavin-adding protein (antitoxin of CptAB toxin-antitoxin module)
MFLEKLKKLFFRQLLSNMDNHQLQWILNHDYPEREKEMAKKELEKRLKNNK